jgi:hypothetical protein
MVQYIIIAASALFFCSCAYYPVNRFHDRYSMQRYDCPPKVEVVTCPGPCGTHGYPGHGGGHGNPGPGGGHGTPGPGGGHGNPGPGGHHGPGPGLWKPIQTPGTTFAEQFRSRPDGYVVKKEDARR